MEKILSQDEINALFSAMSADGANLSEVQDGTPPPGKVENYDFRRADRISQDQMRSIQTLHEYFSRNFSASLSAYLRAFVGVSVISTDQLSYMEFLRLLPDPTLFSTIKMRPLVGNAALELNPSVAFPMIDMLLGGPGSPPAGERSLTEIEINIVEGVLRLAMRDLKEAWRPIMEIDFVLEGSQTKHQGFQIVAPAEAVIALGFEIKLGENTGMMNLCIPSRMLKMIRGKFDQQWHVRREPTSIKREHKIGELLRGAMLDIKAEIRENALTAGDLVSMSEGDIVQLSHRIGDPLVLSIGGMPKFLGRITVCRGKRAFEILHRYVD